jgi:hypothetical protein
MSLSPGPLALTSGYSPVNVDRDDSMTPTNTGGGYTVSRPSSSAGTSVYQGDITASRVSPLPQQHLDIKFPVPLEDDDSQDQHRNGQYAEDDDFYSSEEDESAFVNFALLSHLAVRLRDHVPRGTHIKGSIPYPRAFTGNDIVVSITGLTRSGMAHIIYYSTDDYSNPNTARATHQSQDLDERSKGGHRSRSQSSKPTLLLRGRMGRWSFDLRYRGCIQVPGRPGGRLGSADSDGGTSDRSGDVSDQLLHPLLCG